MATAGTALRSQMSLTEWLSDGSSLHCPTPSRFGFPAAQKSLSKHWSLSKKTAFIWRITFIIGGRGITKCMTHWAEMTGGERSHQPQGFVPTAMTTKDVPLRENKGALTQCVLGFVYAAGVKGRGWTVALSWPTVSSSYSPLTRTLSKFSISLSRYGWNEGTVYSVNV